MILIILISNGFGRAQTITYNMLEYIASHDFKNSSDYLAKNGFIIQKLSPQEGNVPDYYYQFVKSKDINSITIEKKSYGVNAFFYSNKQFIFLKKYIKNKLAFKLDSMKKTIPYNIDSYHKGDLKMDFIEGWDPGFKSKALIRSYFIDLIYIDLYKKRDPHKIEW